MSTNDARPVARLLRYRPAANYLGISYITLRRLIESEALPVVRLTPNGHPMIDRNDLDLIIEQGKNQAVAG